MTLVWPRYDATPGWHWNRRKKTHELVDSAMWYLILRSRTTAASLAAVACFSVSTEPTVDGVRARPILYWYARERAARTSA
jgi:hypothetical protein